MAKTYKPPYTQNPNIGKVTLTTADTSMAAPTTAGAVLMTAGADGTRIDGMKVRALGTNVATVLRIFVNDGQGTAAANFALVDEIQLPASTANAADKAAADIKLLPLNYDSNGNGEIPPYLPAGWKMYVSLGTTVAAGYAVSCYGGDF